MLAGEGLDCRSGVEVKVAVLSADPTIQELVAELITFAGYEPVEAGPAAAGNSLLFAIAPIGMVDVCLPAELLRDCIAAAASADTALVFFGSSIASGDLRTFAVQRNARFFALPGGPTALKRVLDSARPAPRTASSDGVTPVHLAQMSATLSSNSKRRAMLMALLEMARSQGRELRGEPHELFDVVRGRRDALRNSVMDYARVLRNAGLSCERATQIVAELLDEREARVGDDVVGLIDAASRWVEQVYAAA